MSKHDGWLRGVKPKDLADVYRAARDAGCEFTQMRNGHIRIRTPEGRTIQGPYSAHDGKSAMNLKTRLRRVGVNL